MQTILRSSLMFASIVLAISVELSAQNSKGTITLPTRVDPSTEQLLIGVDTLGGRLWCSLDTGFSALVSIDRAKAKRIGILESGSQPTPDGKRTYQGDGKAIMTLHVGPVTMRDRPVILREFSTNVPDMDCVMGAALLRSYVIEFDFAGGHVRLHPPSRFSARPHTAKVPLIFRDNPSVPFVQVQVELPDGTKRDIRTVLDTGCTYYALAIAKPASKWLVERIPSAALPDQAQTASGSLQLVAARPPRITIGSVSVSEPVIALLGDGASLSGVDDGLLGLGFLRRFTLWIDFDDHAVYLAPNRHLHDAQLFDASGLDFTRDGESYVVSAVLAGSPAACADILPGDRLIAVDGKPATKTGFVALRDRLSLDGTTCELTLQRGGMRILKKLRLSRRL